MANTGNSDRQKTSVGAARDLHLPGRSAVYAGNGICATSHPIAAQVAIEIMKAGGNAMDAAIAGAVVLGIAEPQMTGIGGDCFALIKAPGSEDIVALNGSGRSPKGLSAETMRAQGLTAVPIQGIEAVTLPGAIDAFCRLSADYGMKSLQWRLGWRSTGRTTCPA
jgi:gamma-glutamyltranspeptidase/glutathione hydrolase